MIDLMGLIQDFFFVVECDSVELYNEFSLQHELGIFLRNKLPGYKVQFERNVSFFIKETDTIKKEIDISIFNEDKSEKYAIELKHPLNGQYPEQMYSFVKDVKFMEELKERGFDRTAAVALVSNRPFYEGRSNSGIYKYFRDEYAVYGKIFKPTGSLKGKDYIFLNDRYEFSWETVYNTTKYYAIVV